MITLRDYQEAAIAAVNEGLQRGIDDPMIVLPTGAGKTVVFSELIRRRGGTALILAHRDELLDQAAKKLTEVAPELMMDVGFVRAGYNDAGKPIVIASVQTLSRDARLAKFPKDFRTVVVDEAHHAVAPTYRKIIDYLKPELLLGVTATPNRKDRKVTLKDVFSEIVYARSLLEMIRDGYLVDPKGYRITLQALDLGKVKVSRGDYKADDLGEALEEAHAPEHVAATLAERAKDRKSIVFVPTVAIAHRTAAEINAVGIPAAAVDGKTPKEERRQILDDLAVGRLRAVANVGVLTEGFDDPGVDCIVLATPTRSETKYVQMVGRGLRTAPNKEDCLILDMVGSTSDLKLQSLPMLFELKEPPQEGESITGAIDREEEEAELAEIEEAAERQRKAELLAKRRKARKVKLLATNRIQWIGVGDRWVVSAGETEVAPNQLMREYLTLDPVGEGQWRVLIVRKTGARILATGLDLGYAEAVAEQELRERQCLTLADRKAAWRRKPAGEKQLALLQRMGFDAEEGITKGDAGDLITSRMVKGLMAKLDQAREREAQITVEPESVGLADAA